MSSLQKRLAAKVLKVGQSKIWINPANVKDVSQAITKADIRKAVKKGWIKVLQGKVPYPKTVDRRRKNIGSRKGSKFAVVSAKRKWISTIQPLRSMLKELRDKKQIDKKTYKKMYLLAKGGMFRSRAHLRLYLEQHGLLKK